MKKSSLFFRKNFLFVGAVLFLGIIGAALPQIYNAKVDSASAATAVSLTSASANTKTKLLYVGNVYYLAFTSSTSDGLYKVYITTSTNGSTSNWSAPRTNGDVLFTDTAMANTQAFFDFDYNSVGSYFGLVYFTTNTANVTFSTSSDAYTWNTAVTVVGNANNNTTAEVQRRIDLSFSTAEEFAMIGFTDATAGAPSLSLYRIATSTDKGITWSAMADDTTVSNSSSGFLMGVGVSGSGGSRVLHYAIDHFGGSPGVTAPGPVVYGSSSNNGVTWTTTTLAGELASAVVLGGADFAVDDDGYPAFSFEKVDEFNAGAATSSVTYYRKNTAGTWVSSSVASSIAYTVSGAPEPFALRFFNTNKPTIAYPGAGLTTYYGVSSTLNTLSFANTQMSSTAISYLSGFSLAHNSTNNELGVSFVNSSNILSFVTSSLAFAAAVPTAPSGIATSTLATTSILVTWTDNSSDETEFDIGISTDGTIYSATTTAAVGATSKSVTGLTANTRYWFRVAAVNASGTSTYSTIGSGTYTLATTPSAPTVNGAAATTLNVTVADTGATTYAVKDVSTDGNTKYLQTSGAWGDSAVWLTLTQLGSGSATTTTGLSANIGHTISVAAKNGDGTATVYGTAAAMVYTLANAPGTLTVDTPAATTLNLTLNANSNSTTTAYAIYETTAAKYLESDNTLTATTPVWATTSTWANPTVTGLTANTVYTFSIIARNQANTETATTTATAIYTLPAAPTSVAATSISSSQTSISWSGSAATFSIENSTAGTTISGISASPYTVTGLTCGTTYSFKVKGINANSASGAWSSSVTVANNCGGGSSGGGSSYVAPAVTPVVITPVVTPAPVVTPSTVVVPPLGNSIVVNPVVVVANENSKVVFTPPAVASFQPGAPLKFNYQYTNEGDKSVKVKFVRQLINGSGKIIKTASLSKTIKAGISFTNVINDTFAKSLPAGDYTVKVNILDTKNKVLDENSFNVVVEKLKKKYFILNADFPTATDIAFDEAVWKKVKSNVVLPASLKLKYAYTNNTLIKHTIKMVRELLNENGKVISINTGKWVMKVGEKYSSSFTQSLGSNLAAGSYQIRIRAYDWTSKELLAENSVGFVVEFK